MALRLVAVLMLAGAGALTAHAQDYPNRPIRINTGAPGGGVDFTSRQIAQALSPVFGQSFIIENRASGFLSAEVGAKAAPDGYSLNVSGSTQWILPLPQNVNYDVKERFYNAGQEVVCSTPDELTAQIKHDISRLSKLIREGGIKAGGG